MWPMWAVNEGWGMNLRLVLSSMAAAVLLAGCAGGSGGGGTASPTSTASATSTARAPASLADLAKCARANGLPNFPDPVQDAKGAWNFPASVDSLKLPAACDSVRKRLGGQSFGPASASAADLAKSRQFAQCVRAHGLPDWPDPKSDGTFVLPDRLKTGGDALTSGATRACVAKAPGGHFEIAEPDSGGS
jgi:hypothetical protein